MTKPGLVLVGMLAAVSQTLAERPLPQWDPISATREFSAQDGGAPAVTKSESDKTDLARHFGFGALQMYKFKAGMSELRIADLNNDGRLDIAVWNSYQSRIEVLYQPDPAKPGTSAADANGDLERNDLPNRGNLRLENIPVSYRLSSMAVADVTGDKLNDIVFFGEPKEVVILAGKPEGGFSPAVGVRAPEGNPRGGCLCVGDFNHDGRTDVAVLGEEFVLVFHQKAAGGGLEKPLRLVHGIKQPMMIMASDLNGDGRHDLIVNSTDDTYGIHIRLQEASGTLGPQRRVKVPMLRSVTIAPQKSGGDDVFGILHVTGRLKQYHWEKPPATGAQVVWPELLYSYPGASKSKQRPMAHGDVNKDGLVDIVAADPDGAQLVLFEQVKGAGLQPGVAFPGLVKTTDVCIADIDGDGANEVLSASTEEKMIGISRFKDGRLTFPTPFPITGEPYVIAAGSLQAGGPPTQLAYVSKTGSQFAVHMVPARLAAVEAKAAAADSKTAGSESKKPGDKPAGSAKKPNEKPAEKPAEKSATSNPSGNASEQVFEVGGLTDDPAGLRFADINQDGRNDLLLFVRFGGVQAYLQGADGTFTRLTGPESREGLLKDATIPGFDLADVTGDGKPEVLLAQKNLARALVVKNDQWTVVDQYNPENADSEISGIAALRGDAGSPTIAMYDRKSKDLLVLKRRPDNAYAVTDSMPSGSYDLTAMFPAAVSGGDDIALIMADAQTMALLTPSKGNETLVEKHSYESTVKDAWLSDSVAGDVNGDGVRDVAVVDVGKAHVEILTTVADGELVKATRFQVFQGKRFSDAPGSRREPREVLLGDVTGDKIDDVVVLVHDRIIVYPGQ